MGNVLRLHADHAEPIHLLQQGERHSQLWVDFTDGPAERCKLEHLQHPGPGDPPRPFEDIGALWPKVDQHVNLDCELNQSLKNHLSDRPHAPKDDLDVPHRLELRSNLNLPVF